MKGFTPLQDAADMVKDGMTVMIGGFLGCGNPQTLIDRIIANGTKDLTVISNDSPPTGVGISRLIDEHRVKKLITSHVGMNQNSADQMNAGELEICLIPQGSLAEMVRAGGSGLGGIITPTGVGTIVEDNPLTHGTVTIDGREYLIMKALRADIALITAHTVDRSGNAWFKGTTRNFNELMPFAADLVICEADHIVETGMIEPENVMVPGILIDYIVDASNINTREYLLDHLWPDR